MIFSFAFVSPLSADTVTLKNGNPVYGIVVEEDEEKVIVEFDQSATMTFSRNEVDRIVYSSEEERKTLRAEWNKKPQAPPQTVLPRPPLRGVATVPLTPTTENQLILSEGKWWVRKTQHFVVYYQDLTQGKAVADRAEYYLEKIVGDLRLRGYDRKKKYTVFVVREESQWLRFLKSLGIQPELTGGFTMGARTREIFLYGLSIPYLQVAFPHELTHIFLEEMAQGNQIPPWFNEGFANYEGGIIGIDEDLLFEAARNGNHIPLSELVHRTSYPADVEQKKLFYTESEKLIEFLITQYGRRPFGEFTEILLKTGDFEQAFRTIYSGKIGHLAQLEALLLQYISE